MTSKSLERKIQETNFFHPYAGSYYSKGRDHKKRIPFLLGIKKIYDERLKSMGVKTDYLFCFWDQVEETDFLSIWDYSPPTKYLPRTYGAKIYSNKKSKRIGLPKEIQLKRGDIVLVGRGDHFEIYYLNDWNRIKDQG